MAKKKDGRKGRRSTWMKRIRKRVREWHRKVARRPEAVAAVVEIAAAVYGTFRR